MVSGAAYPCTQRSQDYRIAFDETRLTGFIFSRGGTKPKKQRTKPIKPGNKAVILATSGGTCKTQLQVEEAVKLQLFTSVKHPLNLASRRLAALPNIDCHLSSGPIQVRAVMRCPSELRATCWTEQVLHVASSTLVSSPLPPCARSYRR